MTSVNVAERINVQALRARISPDYSKVEEVLKSFNTWAFKREQPSDVELLKSFVSRAVREDGPLSFVAYWGKGPRDEMAEPDLQCLQYLQQMMNRIGAVHKPGTELHLVLTDSHARLNGHKARSINTYFKAVETAASQIGFSCWRLKALTDSMRPSLRMISADDTQHPTELIVELEKSATKWYRGGQSIDQGAKRYFEMNMVERRVIERVFPNSIFITFNSSDLRPLFPTRIPIFYMYSLKKGTAVKPWFR